MSVYSPVWIRDVFNEPRGTSAPYAVRLYAFRLTTVSFGLLMVLRAKRTRLLEDTTTVLFPEGHVICLLICTFRTHAPRIVFYRTQHTKSNHNQDHRAWSYFRLTLRKMTPPSVSIPTPLSYSDDGGSDCSNGYRDRLCDQHFIGR